MKGRDVAAGGSLPLRRVPRLHRSGLTRCKGQLLPDYRQPATNAPRTGVIIRRGQFPTMARAASPAVPFARSACLMGNLLLDALPREIYRTLEPHFERV